MSGKDSRSGLSLKLKRDIIREAENGKKLADISRDRKISKTTVSSILNRDRNKILAAFEHENMQDGCKKIRQSVYPEVDAALHRWFAHARDSNLPISGSILLEKAQRFGDQFKLNGVPGYDLFEKITTGYVDRWKIRYSISEKKLAGESSAVSDEPVNDWKQRIVPEILSKFEPCDIFNADETGLFWRLTPDRTLAFRCKLFQNLF